MSLIVVAVWGSILGFIFFAPSLSLLLYGLVGADRDGYAVMQFMSLAMTDHKLITRGLFVGLYCISSIVFFKKSKKYVFIIRHSIYLVQLLSLFILTGSIAKGSNIIEAFSILVFSGLPVYVMWIVFSFNKNNRKQLCLFVFIQISIALAVLTIPSLSFLDGGFYTALDGFSVHENNSLNYNVPGGGSLKGGIGKYAHFHNPNALGFYSCASIAIGLVILKINRLRVMLRLFAIYLCLAGGFCWLNSLTRGPMILLLCGVIFVSFFKEGKHSILKMVAVFASIILVALLIELQGSSGVLSFLIPDSSDISVTARFDGYSSGLDAIYQHPYLGVDKNWRWSFLGYPHVLPLSFAADFGVFAGILITMIVFGGGAGILITAFWRSYHGAKKHVDLVFAVFLVMIVWGAALTNNLISPILFWICFAEATITVFGVQTTSRSNVYSKQK